MSVKTPDWERFDFFFDPRYFLRFSDETDVFGCMTRSCSWVRHVTTLGFPRGVWRSEREKKAWGSLSEPMFWANGGASFQKATPDSMNITSFHHWCGCDVEILVDQWHFFKQTLCAFWHFFLVKCVKILLGRFVWFIWMNLNIKSLSWTVDNFISPALDRSSEWRNAYWQFTILIPPLGMLRKKERSATKYLWTEMSPPKKKPNGSFQKRDDDLPLTIFFGEPQQFGSPSKTSRQPNILGLSWLLMILWHHGGSNRSSCWVEIFSSKNWWFRHSFRFTKCLTRFSHRIFATKKPSNSPRNTPKELNHKKGRFSREKLLANLTKLYNPGHISSGICVDFMF